jgi:hypothetical protein
MPLGSDEERRSDSSGADTVRRRRARFSETDADAGLRATRVQFEVFRRSRGGGAAVAAVIAAGLAAAPAREGDHPPRIVPMAMPPRCDRDADATSASDVDADADAGCGEYRPHRTSDVSIPASALGRHRFGLAALAAASGAGDVEDSAADHSPAPDGERRREGRRSTGSVTFEFDDAFSDCEDELEAAARNRRCSGDGCAGLGSAPGVPPTRGSSGGGSEASWGDSEERFGQLCVARSVS